MKKESTDPLRLAQRFAERREAPEIEPTMRVQATRDWRGAWKEIGVRPGTGRVDASRAARRAEWRAARATYRQAVRGQR